MRRLAALPLLFLLGCASSGRDLAGSIDRIIAAHPRQTIAVAYYDMDRGTSLLRNEREVFHAASTMKVPVMLGVFDAVSRGTLRLDEPVRVKNEFTSILDGSRYALEAREDSDAELYDLIGKDSTVEELVRRMIVRSSNLATNLVIELAGAPRIMALMKQLGANDIQVLRGVEDDKAYHAGMNNTVTAHDLMLIFRSLASSDAAVNVLLGQEHNDGIPAGLPKGTRVAHKTGSITEISHDAGLVLEPDGERYVLVVLTRGFKKGDDADRVIASIARAVNASR
jgi:beta-lactamase class A